jgi:3-phenylpropionate/trans-cinnamate dioxygenase ferredoxin reductase subunit
MSDDHTPPLRGPDLRADGIALADLADGTPSLAHADGESALVVRLGNAVHLIGATCPHYGAALVGGRVSADGPDGPVIRCPLHHAGFSLRTGEAVRAPAFDPIPCWAAEQRDGRVFAGARAAAPADARVDTTAGQTFVVVGAGAAGLAAVDMLRRRGFAGRLVLVGREPHAPVDRPNLSKEFLTGTLDPAWLPLRPPAWYAERRVELRLGVAAERLDPVARTVTLADGAVLGFDRLLLATGASPIRLELPGASLPHVFVLRSEADARALATAAEHARKIVVIGASFIGLEAAAALRERGLAVDVVAPEARPLERVMGGRGGRRGPALARGPRRALPPRPHPGACRRRRRDA